MHRAAEHAHILPARAEPAERIECRVEGVLPAGLSGAFFRLGGQWAYPPKYADDIPLHADGFVSRFRIADGRVHYAGRYVETARLAANREAGRMRFGYYRNRATDDPDVAAISGSAANTAAFAFAGRLLALKEDGLPYAVDPLTLATLGPCDFDGAFRGLTFTAHPKVDGVTGQLIAFGYQAAGPFSEDVHIAVLDPAGTLAHEIRVRLPWADMIHDMAFTRHHILLPLGGYTIDRAALAAGGPLWRWDPAAPARIGVMRRDGDGRDLRWFTGPKRCLLHTFNAFEDNDGRIVLDAPFYDGNPFPFLPSADGSAWQPGFGTAYVRRLTLDPADPAARWQEERLFDTVIGDLGDIDPRQAGHRHRFCFAGHETPPPTGTVEASFPRPPWPIANSYVRFDIQARTSAMMMLAPHMSLGECVFVPRHPHAAEGDGWLIGVADDLVEGTSCLIVADAERLAEGPLAIAHLPVRAGPQVHGCWVGDGELPLPD